jgi:Flp pilus assembly protein TadD
VPVAWLAILVVPLVAVPQARSNRVFNDLSAANDGRVFLDRLLDAVDEGGVVVAMDDSVLFPLWYSRFVDRSREDFAVISVRDRAAHLERWFPEVRLPAEDELCALFEGSPGGGPARELIPVGNYLPLLVELNAGERTMYADPGLARRLFLDRAVPRGILVEIAESPVTDEDIAGDALHDSFWKWVVAGLVVDPALDRSTAEIYAGTLVEQGLLLLDRGDTKQAVVSLERSCALAPWMAVCHNFLGVAYVESGREQDAMAQFQTALKLDPGLAAPHYNIAMWASRRGDQERARSELRAAVVLEPDNSDYRIKLAYMLEEAGEYEQAEAQFSAAAAHSRSDWSAALAYGDFLTRRRRYAAAVAVYQHAEQLRPGSPSALRALGRCYWALDDKAQALEVTRRLVELQPHNPAAKFDLALMLHRSGRGREAVHLLDDVIRILPNMWEARALKASVLGELGRYWEARNLFEQAADLGASGDAFWETWEGMEASLGHEEREQAIRERAVRSGVDTVEVGAAAVAR